MCSVWKYQLAVDANNPLSSLQSGAIGNAIFVHGANKVTFATFGVQVKAKLVCRAVLCLKQFLFLFIILLEMEQWQIFFDKEFRNFYTITLIC